MECGGGAVVGGADGAAWRGNFEKWDRFRGEEWAGGALVSGRFFGFFGCGTGSGEVARKGGWMARKKGVGGEREMGEVGEESTLFFG